MDKRKQDEASQRLKRQKLLITAGNNNYSVQIRADPNNGGLNKQRIKKNRYSPQGREWLRQHRFNDAGKSQQKRRYDEDNVEDAWWPTENDDSKATSISETGHERFLLQESEKRHQIQTEEDQLVEAALRDLREATESEDGGIEKKLEQLPPSFWQKVSSKIRVKVPLICNVFETHELAVENLLQTYLNVIGLAAHKGIKKYCLIVKNRAKGRVSHDGDGESTEPKASLLVRFFNFINSRLESYLGLSSVADEQPEDSSNDEPVEDSKSLVFHTNKLNLILFPPSMDKVHKVIEEEDGKKSEDITGQELQGELWKGSEAQEEHTSKVVQVDTSSETPASNEIPQRKCPGADCRLRGARHTHAQDLEDEYLNDYYEERRRRLDAKKQSLQRKKYQDDDDLDFGVPYDINLLNPEPSFENNEAPTISPELKEKLEEGEFFKPSDEPDTTDIVEILTSEAYLPTTTLAELTTRSAEPAIGNFHIGKTTAAPQIFAMALPVKLLIFIPLSLLVLILFIILLYAIAHRKKRKSQYDYNADDDEEEGRGGFGNRRIYISDFDNSSEEGADRPPEFRRQPPVLQEKGEKKSRTQSYKDDFVPVGPQKKKRFLRRSKNRKNTLP